MKKLMLLFIILVASVLINTTTVHADTAFSEPQPYAQSNGEIVYVYIKGDEFLNWMEDDMGNLLVRDGDNVCYAAWTDTGAVSTGIPATSKRLQLNSFNNQDMYNGVNLPRLMGSVANMLQLVQVSSKAANIPQAMLDKASDLRESVRPSNAVPNNNDNAVKVGLAQGGAPGPATSTSLRRKVLVVSVKFNNRVELDGVTVSPVTEQEIYDKIFGRYNSVNNFYMKMFNSTRDIIVPATELANNGIIEITLDRHPNTGGDVTAFADWMTRIIENDLVLDENALASLDANGNKILELNELGICFIVHGYEASSTFDTNAVWGCARYYAGKINGSSYRIHNISGVGSHMRSYSYGYGNNYTFTPTLLTIGTICHEFGHMLYHFDDLYGQYVSDDYYFSLGVWSLMANGSHNYSNGSLNGSSPAYADAYNLVKLDAYSYSPSEYGYYVPEVITSGTGSYILSSISDIYKITTSDSNQYFLLQNRKNEDYDMGVFNTINSTSTRGGMLIYHVYEDASNSSKYSNIRVSIVEADGNDGLHGTKTKTANYGEIGDLWGINNKSKLNADSNPNTNIFSTFSDDYSSSKKIVPSGVEVNNILFDDWTKSTTFSLSVTDYTAPVIGGYGTITASNITQNSLTLNWDVASDNATPVEKLRYYVYYSKKNNLYPFQLLNDESNGTLVNSGGSINISSISINNLDVKTTYYFNIVVIDEMGNKAAYYMVKADTKPDDVPQMTIDGADDVFGWDKIVTSVNQLIKSAPKDKGNDISETMHIPIKMNKATDVTKKIIDLIKDKNVELKLEMNNGLIWTIYGKDISKATGIDLSVDLLINNIPKKTIDDMVKQYELDSGTGTRQLSLKHNGEFGLTAYLKMGLGNEFSGKVANLFHYNPDTRKLELQSVDKVAKGGATSFTLTHGSDYLIVYADKVLMDESLLGKINVSLTMADKAANNILYLGGTLGHVKNVTAAFPDALKEAVDKKLLKYSASYKAGNKNVTVSKSGVLEPKVLGESSVATTLKIGEHTLDYLTSVSIKKPSAKLTKTEKTLKLGETYTFTVKLTGYSKDDVTWISRKKGAATVKKNNGKLSVTVIAESIGKDTVVVCINGVGVVEYQVEVVK